MVTVTTDQRSVSRTMMRDERRDLCRLLASLTPEQLDHDSLCTGWSVRDVFAHLLAWDDLLLFRTSRQHVRALATFTQLYVRSLGSMDRLNRRLGPHAAGRGSDPGIHRFGQDDDPQLRWLFEGTNPNAHLAEYVVHHQDIRRALDLPRSIPADRLAAALNGITNLPDVRWNAWRQPRRRWEATDIDWARGRGPIIGAPAETILMVLAGRAVDVDAPPAATPGAT